jgi:ribosome-associated protein
MKLTKADLQRNVRYKTSRSGGAGGQNVNKVELLFSVNESDLFTDEEKALMLGKLQSRLNKDGLLQIVCDEERSQYLNKEKALDKLVEILTRALHVQKKRKKSKPSKASVAARLDGKRRASLKKMGRRKDTNSHE